MNGGGGGGGGVDEMSLKDTCISSFSYGCYFVQRSCNFGREYYEEHFCEIILNLGQWFRRYILSTALASLWPFIQF